VCDINLLERRSPHLQRRPSLRGKNCQLRRCWRKAESPAKAAQLLDGCCAEAFAVCAKPGKRVPGHRRHFDVQLIGGHVLHEGQIRRNEDRRSKTGGHPAGLPQRPQPAAGVHVVDA